MAAEIHVGDVGTSFRIEARNEAGEVIDVSGATELLVWFEKPDGDGGTTTMEKAGALVNDGTDGLFEYVTEAGDLDEAGSWRVQGVFENADGRWHGDITKFKVFANLRDA